MHEIDKARFGSFLAALRREKGMTQKELAEKLFVSDKAVSKWETGVNIPDTALLVPLSELLDVSVTELLMCEKIEDPEKIDTEQIEDVVKTAVAYSDRADEPARRKSARWRRIYPCALIIGAAALLFGLHLNSSSLTVYTVFVLSAIFGAYFCFLAKEKLPHYYDENKISGVYDSAFRMNIPGLYFNNSNWPYIILVGKIWSCTVLALYPLLNTVMSRFLPLLWAKGELYICLTIMLGGLFVPMYIVGKKFE